MIYLYENKLYSLDVNTKVKLEIDATNIKISYAILLDNIPNKFLILGEIYASNKYQAGFFIIDFCGEKFQFF